MEAAYIFIFRESHEIAKIYCIEIQRNEAETGVKIYDYLSKMLLRTLKIKVINKIQS